MLTSPGKLHSPIVVIPQTPVISLLYCLHTFAGYLPSACLLYIVDLHYYLYAKIVTSKNQIRVPVKKPIDSFTWYPVGPALKQILHLLPATALPLCLLGSAVQHFPYGPQRATGIFSFPDSSFVPEIQSIQKPLHFTAEEIFLPASLLTHLR